MSTQTFNSGNLTLICPNLACRRTVRAAEQSRGQVMRCPYCNVSFRVPSAPPGAPVQGTATRTVKQA